MIGVSGADAVYAIAFMAAGVFLTVIFFAALALVVVGHFKPSRALQRAGCIALAIWFLPAVTYFYYLLVATEQDKYRTLSKPEVMYGIPLPAGAQVNFRSWGRRIQWATFDTPQVIQGVDYVSQVTFCGRRICRGTLARDQDIQGFPCRAQTEIVYSEKTGRVSWCTLARPFLRQGVTWPAGTLMLIGVEENDSYLLPQEAEPVRVAGLVVHSGLTVQLAPDGRIVSMRRNQTRPNPDARLEVGDVILTCDRNNELRFTPDGAIQGAVLARDAIINGKPMKAGQPVTIPKTVR